MSQNPLLPNLSKESDVVSARSMRQRRLKITSEAPSPKHKTSIGSHHSVEAQAQGATTKVFPHASPSLLHSSQSNTRGTINNFVARLNPMPPPKSGGSASGSGGDQWAEKASKPSTFQMRKLNLKTIDEQGARTHPVESQTERAQPTPSSKFASELAVQPATARAALAVKQSKPAWSSPSIMPDYIDVSRSTSDANFDRQCLVSAEPVSPADAIRLQGGELTDHEKAEILDYQKVYFLGRRACKQTPDLYMKNRALMMTKGSTTFMWEITLVTDIRFFHHWAKARLDRL